MSEATNGKVTGSFSLLALVVGNTTTRYGLFEGRNLVSAEQDANADLNALAGRVTAAAAQLTGPNSAVVLASDNDPCADELIDVILPTLPAEFFRVGVDVDIPITQTLLAHAKPGQDRLLNALAAWDVMSQACVIVDAGTALTVDFVDGEGVFQGGAIAPGAQMMLNAMHKGTAALPAVKLARPEPVVFGKDTPQAMLSGVFWGIRGLVRQLVERYAEAYGAFPPVIATGSDARLLFEDYPLIDRIVPDLTLCGVEAMCRTVLSPDAPHAK